VPVDGLGHRRLHRSGYALTPKGFGGRARTAGGRSPFASVSRAVGVGDARAMSSRDLVSDPFDLPGGIGAAEHQDRARFLAEVLLGYPGALAHCGASSLMPRPYGVQGDWRAVFTGGVLQSTWTAGFEGHARTELTEYTDQGSRGVELPDVVSYAAVIDHVIACREGRTTNLLAPASVLEALELTLEVHDALTAQQPSPS
jgi:hypothetical protein